MKSISEIKIGDTVVLTGYEGSSCGHNGIVCIVRSFHPCYGYYCVSKYGSYHGYDLPQHLKVVGR